MFSRYIIYLYGTFSICQFIRGYRIWCIFFLEVSRTKKPTVDIVLLLLVVGFRGYDMLSPFQHVATDHGQELFLIIPGEAQLSKKFRSSASDSGFLSIYPRIINIYNMMFPYFFIVDDLWQKMLQHFKRQPSASISHLEAVRKSPCEPKQNSLAQMGPIMASKRPPITSRKPGGARIQLPVGRKGNMSHSTKVNQHAIYIYMYTVYIYIIIHINNLIYILSYI